VGTETRNLVHCADSNDQSTRGNLPGYLKHGKIPYELVKNRRKQSSFHIAQFHSSSSNSGSQTSGARDIHRIRGGGGMLLAEYKGRQNIINLKNLISCTQETGTGQQVA